MEYRRYHNNILVQMAPGEEILEQLTLLAQKENILFAEVTGLGSIREFHICVYDLDKKHFFNNEYHEPMELISLTGTITRQDEKPYLHLHASAGTGAGNAYGGHLKKAVIYATGEFVIRLMEGEHTRYHCEENGLNLLDLK